jgi:hypothetical protein
MYESTFDAFATDMPELVLNTGLSESQVRSALKALAAAGLVDAYDVNDEAQGGSRRGQYKHLTWQCNETYDSTDKAGARSTFDAEFPAPNATAAQPQKEEANMATTTQTKQTLDIPADYRERVLAAVAKGEKYSDIEKALIADKVKVPGKGGSHYPLVRRIALDEYGTPDKVKALRPKAEAKAPAAKKATKASAAATTATKKASSEKKSVQVTPRPKTPTARKRSSRSSGRK